MRARLSPGPHILVCRGIRLGAEYAGAGIEGAEAEVAPIVEMYRTGGDGERLGLKLQPMAAEVDKVG